MFLWSNLDEILYHKRRYSKKDMLNKLTLCGFKILRCTSFVWSLFPAMFISRLLNSKGIKNPNKNDDVKLRDEILFSPLVNKICDKFMKLDEILIKNGLNLPYGGTLVVVAKKP